MGMVNAVIGIATLVGSILASVLPKPKSRVRVICNSLLFAMSFETLCWRLEEHRLSGVSAVSLDGLRFH